MRKNKIEKALFLLSQDHAIASILSGWFKPPVTYQDSSRWKKKYSTMMWRTFKWKGCFNFLFASCSNEWENFVSLKHTEKSLKTMKPNICMGRKLKRLVGPNTFSEQLEPMGNTHQQYMKPETITAPTEISKIMRAWNNTAIIFLNWNVLDHNSGGMSHLATIDNVFAQPKILERKTKQNNLSYDLFAKQTLSGQFSS